MPNPFSPPERIGFVGLGNMGAPMAGRLAAAGFRLMVADANPAAVERFAATMTCERSASLVELGRSCGLVITIVPDGRAVREVLLGDRGVAAGLVPGSVVLEMTSAEPLATRELGEMLAARSIALVDAPVSGGVKGAIDGTLAIMAGGDAAAIDRCRTVLAALGKVFCTGGSGSGHALKALNNYLSGTAMAATAEAMLAGQEFGIDPSVMLDVLNHSTGRNSATERKYQAFVLSGRFDSGFAAALMAKDLRIALELAQTLGTPTRLMRHSAGLWSAAADRLGPGADHTAIGSFLAEPARDGDGE